MINVARLSDNDRRELFRNTAAEMHLPEAIVEKDFWVCFMLDHLFRHADQNLDHQKKQEELTWRNGLTFKGGTSLSKAFDLIHRFSEDIDLILDWQILGYKKDEPWETRTKYRARCF